MSKRLKKTGRTIIISIIILLPGLLSMPEMGLAQLSGDKAYVGSETCMDCHDELGEMFQESSHAILLGRLDNYKDRLCESCHGPGSVHVEEGDAASIINPAKLAGTDEKDPCLTCHGDSRYYKWEFSAHATSDMHCADCHSSHATAGQSLKKDTPDLCYDCHQDVRSAFFMPSHHPVAEGIVSCLDCHDIHGGDSKFVMDDDGRQRCFACHADKEGPFIFEHDPVNEDCGVCHSPHGSIANNLLVQNEPQLCLNCHSMHFHATIPGIDTTDMPTPNEPTRLLNSTEDAFKYGMLTKCTQCHSMVHGTDLPSQSISTGGHGLSR